MGILLHYTACKLEVGIKGSHVTHRKFVGAFRYETRKPPGHNRLPGTNYPI